MFENQGDVEVASRLTPTALGERIADAGSCSGRRPQPRRGRGGTIAHALEHPVGQLPDLARRVDRHRPTVVYCAGGYRSSMAAKPVA